MNLRDDYRKENPFQCSYERLTILFSIFNYDPILESGLCLELNEYTNSLHSHDYLLHFSFENNISWRLWAVFQLSLFLI